MSDGNTNEAGPGENGPPLGDFELADETAPHTTRPPTPQPAPPKARPAGPVTTNDDTPLLTARRKGRLLRQVPGFAVGFLLVGWICLGSDALPYALSGAAMGAWAGWSRRGEILVGSLAAVVGLATWFAVVGFVPGMGMGISIVGCGIVGFIAGLDDRLRGA